MFETIGRLKPCVCRQPGKKPCICCAHRREKYKVLERFEVVVPEEQVQQLDALEGAWAKHLAMLDNAAVRLEKFKDSFRDKVHSSCDQSPRMSWLHHSVWWFRAASGSIPSASASRRPPFFVFLVAKHTLSN